MDALSAYQIKRVMRKYPGFHGVFAADQIPKKLPGGMIVNTDESHLPGTHWVAIFIDKKGKLEFFDSYGLPPLVQHHINYLDKYKYNTQMLQSPTSALCGHYCMLYLDNKFRGISMKKFLEQMKHDNVYSNDACAIIRFITKFGVLPKCRKPSQACRCRV